MKAAFILLALAGALLLGACAHAPQSLAKGTGKGSGTGTGNSAAAARPSLAPPDTLPARSAAQIIHAIYGARALTLRTAIQLDATTLKVVGVTATGQRLFTAEWDGKSVTAEKSAFVPDNVQPERVLADVQLALWPLAPVQSAFAPAGFDVSEPFAGVRRLTRGGALIAEVHYATADPWNGRLWFVNFEFDYSLTIDTSIASPN